MIVYELINVLIVVLFIMQLYAKGSIDTVLHLIRRGNHQSKMIIARQLIGRSGMGLSLEFHLAQLGKLNLQFVLTPNPPEAVDCGNGPL